jgi:protein TonB
VSSPARPGCSPVAALDAAAALAAIVQWRFSNSVDRLGRPVRVVLDIPVEFSLR